MAGGSTHATRHTLLEILAFIQVLKSDESFSYLVFVFDIIILLLQGSSLSESSLDGVEKEGWFLVRAPLTEDRELDDLAFLRFAVGDNQRIVHYCKPCFRV